MSANYKLVRMPDLTSSGTLQPLHVRLVSQGTVSIEDVMRDMKSRSSFSPADIKGMLQLIQDIIADYLLMGYNVEIDGIGTFSVSLKCRPVMDKKEIRAESVRFRSVNYRASTQLCKRLKSMPVFRQEGYQEKKLFTQDECRERLLQYLEQHKYLTRKDYMRFTRNSQSKAVKDLKFFCQEGIIERKGRGPTTFYMQKEI